MFTRKQLIHALSTTETSNGTRSDGDAVRAIVYNSNDGGMTRVERNRPEYDDLEFLFAEPYENGIQLVFQLAK